MLPGWCSGKESVCQCRRCRFHPWVKKIPWRRAWQPTLVFLSGKSHGQTSLAGYSPWSCKSQTLLSDQTTRFHWIYMPHFPYLFIHGYLGCFYTLAIVTNDTVNTNTSTNTSFRPCFQFFQIYTPKWNWWIIW